MNENRILVARTDRMGDVLMSLHAIRCLRKNLPGRSIDFLVQPDLAQLLGPTLQRWEIAPLPWGSAFFTTPTGYGAALCLFDEPRLVAWLKRSKIAVRVGNYSKLRSFLKLTHGLRQRRALGKKPEGEYNLELAKLLLRVVGAESAYTPEPITLELPESAATEADLALGRISLKPGEPFWVAHPGMGGSALNLSVAAYASLIDGISKEQRGPLVLTLGPARADFQFVEAIADLRSESRILPKVSLSGLAEVFRRADLVLAPSTGPLHLAHYMGSKTLGVYSPVRSHQPRRWAPWGGSGQSLVLSPQHPCPGRKNCRGKRCKHFYCLDRLAAAGLPTDYQNVLRAGAGA